MKDAISDLSLSLGIVYGIAINITHKKRLFLGLLLIVGLVIQIVLKLNPFEFAVGWALIGVLSLWLKRND